MKVPASCFAGHQCIIWCKTQRRCISCVNSITILLYCYIYIFLFIKWKCSHSFLLFGFKACMLVFYPNFDTASPGTADEVVLLLDASQSMKGESFNTARTIALQILKTLENNVSVNVIFFGTGNLMWFSSFPLSEISITTTTSVLLMVQTII